ncbi:MAG: glycosyltransferase [Candidatus Hydrogenedentes bacterium]|nr:glycosyltransferase [Candidatus Hydrogenedentota bacterium]
MAVAGATIHDLGHLIGPKDHGSDGQMAAAIESRHTHRLELWLRLVGQPDLAGVIRHSAPMFVADARSGRLSLAQVLVAWADARTNPDGTHVPLDKRAQDVVSRKASVPGWRPDLQKDQEVLLNMFDAWIGDARSRFADTIEPPVRRKHFVFVERCDGKYTGPVGDVRDSNSIYHLCRTTVAATWNASVVCSTGDAPTSAVTIVPSHADAAECARIAADHAPRDGLVVSSWLSLFMSGVLPRRLRRVLLLRGLRCHRVAETYFAGLRNALQGGDLDRVVVVGQALHALLAAHDVPSQIIPGGIDVRYFVPCGRAKRRQVLFVGAPIRGKGIGMLIQAAEALRRLQVEVVIAGDPRIYERDASDSRVANAPNVRFLGFVPNAQLPRIYEESLATVIPTDPAAFFEGFSKVAVESLSMGTPLIVSNCGNLPNWVRQGLTGWLLEPYEPEAIVNTVRENLDALVAAEFASDCVAMAEPYSWERSAWELDRLYDELLVEKGSMEAINALSPYERMLNVVQEHSPSLLQIPKPPIEDRRSRRSRGLVLAIEPHPDDVAYSCSLELLELWYEGFDIMVVSAFSGADLTTFRYAAHLVLSPQEYQIVREEENERALCRYLPFSLRQLSLPSARGRGYESAFSAPRDDDLGHQVLRAALADYEHIAKRVYAPAGFGGHADHLLAREIACDTFSEGIVLYEEPPYVKDDPDHVDQLRAQEWRRRPVREPDLDRKIAVVSHYLSQLPVRSLSELSTYVGNWLHGDPPALEAFWERGGAS